MATQLALAGLSYLPGGGLLISTVNTASSTTTSVLKSAWTGRPSTSTSTTRRTSGSTFFARSPSVGYEDSSLESASSLLAPSTPPPPATSPPLRPLMLSTLRQHRTTTHHHHHQRSSVSMGGPDVMMLGTTCSGCGTHVQVQVPPWMLTAIEGSQHRYSDTWRDDQDHHYHHSSSGPPGARAPRIEGQQQPYRRPRQADWRSTIVHTAIGTAHAIKASPIPGLILTFFRAMFAFALLLDARFSLHQRAAVILSRFLEGLVEIEKEVGVMRGAGEALSIGWEATVKGIIAFAKADSFANTYSTHDQPRKTSQPTTSIFTRQQPSSQHNSRESAQQSSYFPPYHETHTYTAAKPAEPAPFFNTSGDYPRHAFSSGQGGGVLLADSEEDEQVSTSSPRLGVDLDYSHETSCPPSPPPPPSTSTAHGRAEMAHPRPLRRTPMSSPALQSAYLAQSGGSRNPTGLPTSASATFGASSSSSMMTTTYPFLASSSSPTETLLPPYEPTGRAGTKPHPLHHSAVAAGSSSSSYGTTDGGGGGGALHLRHHRSRSGPGNTHGGDDGGGGGLLYLAPGGELLSNGGGAMPGPPPPSPVGSRAGWAGKAMLGLAERMKVI
ncbi:hypothetical protein B0A53_00280 [Rhodotorula sp. CCFEE 5036]|nr:hypothetical protein B0A53_00280 [Rhodotorula sp. CCFEE 5036]